MKNKIALIALLSLTLGLSACGESSSVTSLTSENITMSEVTQTSETPSTSGEEEDIIDRDLICSPNGEATSADGTEERPFSLQYAIKKLQSGRKILMKEGVYKMPDTVLIDDDFDGEEGKMKTIMPLNGGKVVLDFTGMIFASTNRGLEIKADYWHVKDLEVKGAGDNGIYIGGNNNIIENCVTHDNMDTGIQLGRKSSSCNDISTWPANNLIKNCTSFDNHDPSGEDSDGFACKLTTGYGNVFDGCIAYNNVDDGWDLYAKGETGPIGPVTLKNCVAFNNGITSKGVGTSNSDGNGFKLGGETIAVQHVVENCIAFNNLACGFTDNSNPGTIRMTKCTSYNNGVRDADANNYEMCRDEQTSQNFFSDLLSYCSGEVTNPIDNSTTIANSKDEYKGTVEHSVFYRGLTMLKFDEIQPCDYTVESLSGTILETEDTPFVSVEVPNNQLDLHNLLRNEDGSVNLGDFLKVKEGTIFATMGTNNGPIGASLHN